MVTKDDCIGGDGGPMIVFQSSVVSQWRGATDFDRSLMMGGDVETDYDVVCNAGTGVLINRYDHDMLVLDDSEWGAYIFPLSDGRIAVVQQYMGEDDVEELVERVSQRRPSQSFAMDVKNVALRLLVGAEDGPGKVYGYKDVSILPGKKRCDVFFSEDELVIIINPA